MPRLARLLAVALLASAPLCAAALLPPAAGAAPTVPGGRGSSPESAVARANGPDRTATRANVSDRSAAEAVPESGGGVRAGRPTPTPPGEGGERRGRGRARERGGRRPVLAAFSVGRRSFYLYGAPATVSFEITARSRTVRVGLEVFAAGGRRPVRRIDLGERRTGTRQTYALTGREGGALPEGALRVRISARDARGRAMARARRASAVDEVAFHWHRHPLAGRFTYALGDGRFGAPRGDHRHQGQDLSAATGTPVVAPRGGTVEVVAYQAGGAGNYVVLDGDGEDADYVFMHLHTGSVRVRRGQRVVTGQRLADVGNTGYSTGPHLHFEIWRGGWARGRPVDPLPDLRRWGAWS